MKKAFDKHETLFCILLIIIYIVLNSFCVQSFGDTSLAGFIVNTLLSVGLIVIIVLLKRTAYYGFNGVKNARQYLYFIPLLAIVSVNLWGGINTDKPTSEIGFHILTMVNVGFAEEVIFRGFLFKMMAKNGVKSAVIVSSVTFGAGHIINLLNGAELVPTLLQICCAISIGYLFVIIFYKSHSIIPCIITHIAVNSLSVFKADNPKLLYVETIFLIAVPLVYAIYINKKVKAD